MSKPSTYSQFEQTKTWKVLDKAITNLVKNQDLKEITLRHLIIGFLCQSLKEKDLFVELKSKYRKGGDMKTNQTQFGKIYLHDAEIVSAKYSYLEGVFEVMILQRDPPNTPEKQAKLFFSGVKKIAIDSTKPWGDGTFIFEHEIVQSNSAEIVGSLHYRIKLNSGDTLDIIAEEFSFYTSKLD